MSTGVPTSLRQSLDRLEVKASEGLAGHTYEGHAVSKTDSCLHLAIPSGILSIPFFEINELIPITGCDQNGRPLSLAILINWGLNNADIPTKNWLLWGSELDFKRRCISIRQWGNKMYASLKRSERGAMIMAMAILAGALLNPISASADMPTGIVAKGCTTGCTSLPVSAIGSGLSIQPAVSPLYGSYWGGSVTIRAFVSLAGATAVYFGSQSVPFTVQPDGSLLANAPSGVPGSTVGVSVVLKGQNQVLPSSATFSYPIAQLNVTGPLPYSLGVSGDSAWYNGRMAIGYSMNLGSPQTNSLAFSNFNPPLYINTSFYNDSDTNKFNYTGPNYSVGNLGLFSVGLQVCEVQTGQTGEACKNWDGNQGTWKNAMSPNATAVVTTSQPGATATQTMTLSTTGIFLNPNDVVKTVRYETVLAQGDTTLGATQPGGNGVVVNSNMRRVGGASAPFAIVITPQAMMQINAIPYTIIYQPPGNQSTVTFQTLTTYGANFALGGSKEVDNTYSTDSSGSLAFAVKEMIYAVGFNGGTTDNWDTTTTQTFGSVATSNTTGSSAILSGSQWGPTATDVNLIPGSGVTCASPTNCTTKKSPPTGFYQSQPFWQDIVVLLVHSQIAVWTVGNNTPGRWVAIAAVPAFVNMTVGQLDACARGYAPHGLNQCQQLYSSQTVGAANGTTYKGIQGTLTLTPSEARAILALDPFYAGGQNAQLDTTRIVPIASPSYGTAEGQTPQAFIHPYSNTSVTQNNVQTQSTTTLSVTSVVGSQDSDGLTIGGSAGSVSANDSLTVTAGDKNTSGQTIKTTFTNSTAASTQQATSINVTLNDFDNTTQGNSGQVCKNCHAPLPNRPTVNIYLDKLFGSFMFQDPYAPPPPAASSAAYDCCIALIGALVHQEAGTPRFSDVPVSDAACGQIGVLAKFNILPGITATSFSPASPLTSTQMASAIAALSRTTASGQAAPPTSGAPASVNQPVKVPSQPASANVTREQFAVTLARTFNLQPSPTLKLTDQTSIALSDQAAVSAVLAKGYLAADVSGAFHPAETMTREQAAQALFLVFQDYIKPY